MNSRPSNALATVATLETLELSDAALATSAHYFADRIQPCASFGPIIHPRSGELATRVRSATVRAPSAMLADALTKVVMLCGEAALPVLDHFGADAIFVAQSDEARCTAGWHAAIQFSS